MTVYQFIFKQNKIETASEFLIAFSFDLQFVKNSFFCHDNDIE